MQTVKPIIRFLLVLLLPVWLEAQEITNPNFALATHPFTVDKISVTDSIITVTLTLENKVGGGSFCASEIIYIQEIPSKKKAYLKKSTGIPVCPERHKFKKAGEKLTFELEFFGFYEQPKYINIVEECFEFCFTIFGVIVDEQMNQDIDMGFALYKTGNLELSVASFEKAVNENPDYPFGYLYEKIIDVYAEMKDYDQATIWFDRLKASEFLDKDQLVERISHKDYYSRIESR